MAIIVLTLHSMAEAGRMVLVAQSTPCTDVLLNSRHNSPVLTILLCIFCSQVSCTGLEEYTQLLIKFGDAVQRFLGEGWQCRLAELRNRSPGRKYSRLHMPDGVGCFGNTMGQDGTSADAHLEAAQRAQQALDKWRRENGVEEQHDELEPDWEAIIDTLAEVNMGWEAMHRWMRGMNLGVLLWVGGFMHMGGVLVAGKRETGVAWVDGAQHKRLFCTSERQDVVQACIAACSTGCGVVACQPCPSCACVTCCNVLQVEPGELEEDEDQLPQPPDVPDTDKKTKKAFKDAVEKQRERIEECRAYNAEHGRAEVGVGSCIPGGAYTLLFWFLCWCPCWCVKVALWSLLFSTAWH